MYLMIIWILQTRCLNFIYTKSFSLLLPFVHIWEVISDIDKICSHRVWQGDLLKPFFFSKLNTRGCCCLLLCFCCCFVVNVGIVYASLQVAASAVMTIVWERLKVFNYHFPIKLWRSVFSKGHLYDVLKEVPFWIFKIHISCHRKKNLHIIKVKARNFSKETITSKKRADLFLDWYTFLKS